MGNKVKHGVLFLLSSLFVWAISIPLNYFIGIKLSYIYFKEAGQQEIDHAGIGFDYLIIITFFYILLFFTQFYYLKKYKFISYISIGLWILTIILIYFLNQ